MEIETGSIPDGARVLIVDDLIATGGTANAARKLVEKCGGKVVGFSFVMELLAFTASKLRKLSDQFAGHHARLTLPSLPTINSHKGKKFMDLYEYQARELLEEQGICDPRGRIRSEFS